MDEKTSSQKKDKQGEKKRVARENEGGEGIDLRVNPLGNLGKKRVIRLGTEEVT